MPNFCPNALQSERKYDIIPSQRKYAPLAQLDRAQASDAWCRRFESAMVCQQKGNFCPPKVPFLFIQAAGLAYHQGSASRPFKLLTKCSTNKPFVKIAKGTNIKPPLCRRGGGTSLRVTEGLVLSFWELINYNQPLSFAFARQLSNCLQLRGACAFPSAQGSRGGIW